MRSYHLVVTPPKFKIAPENCWLYYPVIQGNFSENAEDSCLQKKAFCQNVFETQVDEFSAVSHD